MEEKQKAVAAAHDAQFTEGQASLGANGANHYVFKSNEAEVLKDVKDWLGGLE